MEKRLFYGQINSNELKSVWNKNYFKYLGIIPKNDCEGILQDTHWATGNFGYFPSYFITNLYAAQIFNSMKKSILNISKKIENGEFNDIVKWLNDNIFLHGKLYSTKELLLLSTGEPLNPNYYIGYLTNKYSVFT